MLSPGAATRPLRGAAIAGPLGRQRPRKTNGPACADPVRTQPHLAPRVARCTNRQNSGEFATFRVFHRLRPESGWDVPRPSARPARPTRANTADRATTWRVELASGAIPSRAALARREGLSRARITQILRRVSPSQERPPAVKPVTVHQAELRTSGQPIPQYVRLNEAWSASLPASSPEC